MSQRLCAYMDTWGQSIKVHARDGSEISNRHSKAQLNQITLVLSCVTLKTLTSVNLLLVNASDIFYFFCSGDLEGKGLETLTSSNKESRPFFLGDKSIWRLFPLFLLLTITSFGAPEGYFSLAIIAFGALEFSVPSGRCWFLVTEAT